MYMDSTDGMVVSLQEKQLRREAEKAHHEKRREEIAAQVKDEHEMLQSALAKRHEQAMERHRTQWEMRQSHIKHAGWVAIF